MSFLHFLAKRLFTQGKCTSLEVARHVTTILSQLSSVAAVDGLENDVYSRERGQG